MVTLVPHDGYSPAPGGDRHRAAFDELSNDLHLQDLPGAWRGDDPTPAAARVLKHAPAVGTLMLPRLRLFHEPADRLRRRLKRGIIRVHENLGNDRGNVAALVQASEDVSHRRLDVVPERTLGVRDAGVEGNHMKMFPRELRATENEAHLRPVTVDDRQFVLRGEQRRHVLRRQIGRLVLGRDGHVLRVGDERVASNGDDDLLTHCTLMSTSSKAVTSKSPWSVRRSSGITGNARNESPMNGSMLGLTESSS